MSFIGKNMIGKIMGWVIVIGGIISIFSAWKWWILLAIIATLIGFGLIIFFSGNGKRFLLNEAEIAFLLSIFRPKEIRLNECREVLDLLKACGFLRVIYKNEKENKAIAEITPLGKEVLFYELRHRGIWWFIEFLERMKKVKEEKRMGGLLSK